MDRKSSQKDIKEQNIGILASEESSCLLSLTTPVSQEKMSIASKKNQQSLPQSNGPEHGLNVSNNSSNNSSTTSSFDSNEECDPGDSNKLDILSKDFDPLAALYCKDIGKIKNIVPEAPVLDNVATFEALYYKKKNVSKHGAKTRSENTQNIAMKKAESNEATSARNFTPEQMPVAGTKRELNNVSKFMKKQSGEKGPMSILQKCVDTERRVKIVIRGNFKQYCIRYGSGKHFLSSIAGVRIAS